jgi:uncharacterized protein YbjT (DUF2867 family)
VLDKKLSLAVAKDLPAFYDRMRSIALAGEDADALKAITSLMDRLLGKAMERQEISLSATGLTQNVVFFPAELPQPPLAADGTFTLIAGEEKTSCHPTSLT